MGRTDATESINGGTAATSVIMRGTDSDTTKIPKHSEGWRTAKAVLTTALDYAVIAVDGLPIPGAKAALSGVVTIPLKRGKPICLLK